MLAQLQQTFPKLCEEIVLDALKWSEQDIEETKDILTWITENTYKNFVYFLLFFLITKHLVHIFCLIMLYIGYSTNLQQQHHLMKLLKQFDIKLEKTTISQTWKNYNQIYEDTFEKLREICATSNLNELKEYKANVNIKNELKISREMCLHILWNILKYPKHIKYRQIHKQALYNYLFQKCHTLGADFEKVLMDMENELEDLEFKKGNDENWYYQYDRIQLLHLWKCYSHWINQQIVYKTRYNIPKRVCMLWNGKWKDYESVFDYEHRTIMLFDENKLKIKSLQLGNPKRSSLEFNVSIQWYNDLSDVHNTHVKWACLILNHTWHFRTIDWSEREDLANCVSVDESKNIQIIDYVLTVELLNCYTYISNTQEFNSFHVVWKDVDKRTNKEPLNPYSITFKQGIQHVKQKLQMRQHFVLGRDELILFECEFDKCKPAISSKVNDSDILLHDIYKHLPHYPIIQVHWEIFGLFMVPYKRTICIERNILPKSNDLGIEFIPIYQKAKFNPLLYECDLHKLKMIQDEVNVKTTRNNSLQKLFHEVIGNDYKDKICKNIKKQINYNRKNPNELILNDFILTILNELKILYHDDIHKQMGYPLQLWHICAILLYCGKSCN
ncbi:hypothetical protein RFI_20799, partial [Reticulomyxa filosa]